LPLLVAGFLGVLVLAWAVSRWLDSKPYLFNDGELGYLEKKSVFVKKAA
jgi:hypothetical protein